MEIIFIEQSKAILEEPDMIAALSNLSALINESFDRLNWAGFYFAKNGELVLGPFQGKVACTHIPFDKGVCGLTYRTCSTQIVPDVHAVKDHIACDSASRSELCVPVMVNGSCVLEIDLDSPEPDRFDQDTADIFNRLADLITDAWITYGWTA